MLTGRIKKCIVYPTIFSFLVIILILPSNSYAGYESQRDKLGGDMGDVIKLVAICAAVVVTIYLIKKAAESPEKSDSEIKDQKEQETESDTLSSSGYNQRYLNNLSYGYTKGNNTIGKDNVRIMPFLGLQNTPKTSYFSSEKICNQKRLVIGFAVNF